MSEVERLITLIDEIKTATGLTQEQIAKRVGYKREYLSQAKKTGSDIVYYKLLAEFKEVLEKTNNINVDTTYLKECEKIKVQYENLKIRVTDLERTIQDKTEIIALQRQLLGGKSGQSQASA